MRSDVLEHRFTVSALPDEVLSHLADPANYVGLNPYVVAVRDVRQQDGTTAFTAIEHLTVLGLGWDNPIDVVSRIDKPNGRQVMDVVSRGGVAVRIVTSVAAAPSGSTVEDTITLTCPAPIRAFARKRARAGQLHRAARLNDRLNRPVAGPE
jgi:hypothetical protein